MSQGINIQEILRMLPHRYPFLLVDKVLSYKIGQEIIAIKNVTANEPQFMGHFPENPIMPGVLIIEAMAQAAGILIGKSVDDDPEDKMIYFMSIDSTKFRQIVRPGDVLELHAKVLQQRGPVWKFSAEAIVEGKIVAESVFAAAVKDRE